MAHDRVRHRPGRTLLVRRAEQVHGGSLDGQASREEPGGGIGGPGPAQLPGRGGRPRAGRARPGGVDLRTPRSRMGARQPSTGGAMSAGSNDQAATVSRDLNLLAPAVRAAGEAAIAECQARGLDAYVYEAYRSPELQAIYYARGRTVVPPTRPVTYAATNLQSWHGYGLA